jgi:chromosome partitioning protein
MCAVALSENGDLVERGRAIFDRLRQGTTPPDAAEDVLPEDAPEAQADDEPPRPEEVGAIEPDADADDALPEDAAHASSGDAVDATTPADRDVTAISESASVSPTAVQEPAGHEGLVAGVDMGDEPQSEVAEGTAPPLAPPALPEREDSAADGGTRDNGRPAAHADADSAPPEPTPELVGGSPSEQSAVPGEGEASEGSALEQPPASMVSVVADAAAVLDDATAAAGSTDATVAAGSTAVSPTVRPLPRILAIANQKGGVGKTTTAVNLGAALAELGYRVLVIDLDPQGNATTGLGINPRSLESSVYDVIMHDTPLEDCIEPTSLRNLFVVPATIDLAGAEIELVPAFSRELKLRRALEDVTGEFDYTLIDCPPSLGLITVNGLAAATEVVVPIQCEYYALEGLGQLLRNVNLVQSNLNPKLEVSAIILTMFDARTKLADQVASEVRAHFGDKVCRNIVPRTVRLSEAPSFGQPIIVFDPSSRGAIAYRELAKEVSGGAPQRVG